MKIMAMPPKPRYATVAPIWSGATVVCLGGGPSLTKDDVLACRGHAKVIAINDAYRICDFADVLYSGDLRWIAHHQGVPGFHGLKFSIERAPRRGDQDHRRWPEWQVLRHAGVSGLERSPDGLRTGRNSGAQAIGLAVHLGATRIVLLGYDMGLGDNHKAHWFGDHPYQCRASSPFQSFRDLFKAMAGPLQERGVEVVNCSRVSRLECFERRPLLEVIRPAKEVAA